MTVYYAEALSIQSHLGWWSELGRVSAQPSHLHFECSQVTSLHSQAGRSLISGTPFALGSLHSVGETMHCCNCAQDREGCGDVGRPLEELENRKERRDKSSPGAGPDVACSGSQARQCGF